MFIIRILSAGEGTTCHASQTSPSRMLGRLGFLKIEKLEKPNEQGPYDDLLAWFFKENELLVEEDSEEKNHQKSLDSIPAIKKIMKKFQSELQYMTCWRWTIFGSQKAATQSQVASGLNRMTIR